MKKTEVEMFEELKIMGATGTSNATYLGFTFKIVAFIYIGIVKIDHIWSKLNCIRLIYS